MIARILAVIGVAAAALVCVPPASADIHTLVASGLWTAYGGTGDDKLALCGIGTAGVETRRIAIQQYAGDNGLDLRLTKDSWTIPASAQVEIQVQFDGASPVPMQAAGTDHQLVVNMTFDQSVAFMRGVRSGRQIRIVFQSGNELPWVGGLTGSARAIDAFNGCRRGLAPAAATQPFGAGPAAPSPGPAAPAPAEPVGPSPPVQTNP